MAITYYVPRGPLNAAVATIWHCEGYVLPHAWERMMPTCGVTLLVNLQDDELRWRDLDGGVHRLPGIGICGPQPRPFEIDTAQQRFIMGVEFELTGARWLLGVPIDELAAGHLGLADLWGRKASRLQQQLVEAPSAPARFAILEAWLLERASERSESSALVSRALALLEGMSVAAVTRQLGVVPKRLIRAFKSEVGLAPKRYCRIRRFERLLSDIEQSREVDWAATAARHGYYDQAHLVHEFRELSSFTPREYLTRRGPYARHVPLG